MRDSAAPDDADEAEDEGDTWDTMFDDDGEALDPKLMQEVRYILSEVTHASGEV